MTKRHILPTILLALIAFCGSEKKPATKEKAATPQFIPFVPPSDSTVTRTQLESWIKANPLLDSLSYLYKDSFQVDQPATQLRLQHDFVRAQDKICVRVGLSGGYQEYVWVLKNAGNPRNKPILDSLGLSR